MTKVQQAAFDIIEALSRATTETQVHDCMRDGGAALGYENFCMTGLPSSTKETIDDHIMVCGWPAEWMARYSERDYIHVDPAISKIRQTTLPFDWREAHYSPGNKAAAAVMNESPSFGLVSGMCVPIHDMLGFQAAVSFSASFKTEWVGDTRAAIHLIGIFAHGRASALIREKKGMRRKPMPKLSSREIECLKWSSEGKTAWEISTILGLSARTVELYLTNAARKLSAVNRVQAVAEAIRSGAIY